MCVCMCVCVCVVVTVELTEADYQRREGQSSNVIVARVSYDRDIVNNILVTLFPVTYDQYDASGLTLPPGFPNRLDGDEYEARG